MLRVTIAAIVTFGICSLVSSCQKQIDNTRKQNIYYNTAVVITTGQCKDSKCSYSYRTSTGEIQYGVVSTPVTVGQIVYQQCWTEKVKGPQCYTEYEPSKSNE